MDLYWYLLWTGLWTSLDIAIFHLNRNERKSLVMLLNSCYHIVKGWVYCSASFAVLHGLRFDLIFVWQIALGEELTSDYHYELVPGEGSPCLCGSSKCRGRLHWNLDICAAVVYSDCKIWDKNNAQFENIPVWKSLLLELKSFW